MTCGYLYRMFVLISIGVTQCMGSELEAQAEDEILKEIESGKIKIRYELGDTLGNTPGKWFADKLPLECFDTENWKVQFAPELPRLNEAKKLQFQIENPRVFQLSAARFAYNGKKFTRTSPEEMNFSGKFKIIDIKSGDNPNELQETVVYLQWYAEQDGKTIEKKEWEQRLPFRHPSIEKLSETTHKPDFRFYENGEVTVGRTEIKRRYAQYPKLESGADDYYDLWKKLKSYNPPLFKNREKRLLDYERTEKKKSKLKAHCKLDESDEGNEGEYESIRSVPQLSSCVYVMDSETAHLLLARQLDETWKNDTSSDRRVLLTYATQHAVSVRNVPLDITNVQTGLMCSLGAVPRGFYQRDPDSLQEKVGTYEETWYSLKEPHQKFMFRYKKNNYWIEDIVMNFKDDDRDAELKKDELASYELFSSIFPSESMENYIDDISEQYLQGEFRFSKLIATVDTGNLYEEAHPNGIFYHVLRTVRAMSGCFILLISILNFYDWWTLPVSVIPEIAQGYEKEYLNFLQGKIICTPNDNSNSKDRVELPFAALTNPLEGTIDLSRCGDIKKYIRINTGYQSKLPISNHQLEILVAPRFLIERHYNRPNLPSVYGLSHTKCIDIFGLLWRWPSGDLQYTPICNSNINLKHLLTDGSNVIPSKTTHYETPKDGGCREGGIEVPLMIFPGSHLFNNGYAYRCKYQESMSTSKYTSHELMYVMSKVYLWMPN